MIVAMVALSLLCLGNLLLTVGVVRRLKEHAAVLNTLASEPPEVMRAAGALADDFAVTTVDGTPISRDLIAVPTLFGFFSPTCGSCREQLPDFVARARRAPAGRTVAVVVGARDNDDETVATLTHAALVVVEPRGGMLATAFGVRGYPAFGLVGEGGLIEASGTSLPSIPMLVGA